MMRDSFRVLLFGRSWRNPGGLVEAREVEVLLDGEPLPATFLLPRRRWGRVPGWVVLHGITRPGRDHPELLRFANALTASGAAVLIPEIAEWMDLRLAMESVAPVIRASVHHLSDSEHTDSGRIGLLGFSFGAPQAMIASTDPSLQGRLAAVVGYGSYCDPERTARFLFTGEHEWEGKSYRQRSDPYGRWILGANYLTSLPGHEDAGDVAKALWRLAAEAGERRILSWDPAYDVVKDELEETVAPERRALFRLFAPPAEKDPPPPDKVGSLVTALTRAMTSASPLTDPTPYLAGVKIPVHLLHGREDHLIPFSETLHLAELLQETTTVYATVTGLFGHSYRHRALTLAHQAREAVRFFTALRRLLGAI